MSDIADVYDETRIQISDLLSGLSEEDLARSVPATPEWSIKDVVGHLSGIAVGAIGGSYPRDFFASFGKDPAVASLNQWTQRQVDERRDVPLRDVLNEWEDAAKTLTSMMREETPSPEGIMFAPPILATDVGVHLHDIYGALEIKKDREGPPVRIGVVAYIAGVGIRLGMTDLPAVAFDLGDKTRVAGTGEPAATVRIDRFELFRALSGRRNPDQIKSYDWDRDPEPYIPFFYPYGIREGALVE